MPSSWYSIPLKFWPRKWLWILETVLYSFSGTWLRYCRHSKFCLDSQVYDFSAFSAVWLPDRLKMAVPSVPQWPPQAENRTRWLTWCLLDEEQKWNQVPNHHLSEPSWLNFYGFFTEWFFKSGYFDVFDQFNVVEYGFNIVNHLLYKTLQNKGEKLFSLCI